MSVRKCRICGEKTTGRVVGEGRTGCAHCGDSPLCDVCGHPRRSHKGVFSSIGTSGCNEIVVEFQSLAVESCGCSGYVPRTRDFSDAAFAEEGEPPRLRIAGS